MPKTTNTCCTALPRRSPKAMLYSRLPRFLVDNPGAAVLLEGHTDARGSREYNIALGERRGNAVQQVFVVFGIPPSRIKVVSYGEERPAAPGQSEADFGLNRRVEITY